MDHNVIYNMNCLEGLKILPDKSIHCCITSPPYYGLRDYGHKEHLGLEKTPEEYISGLVAVFREVHRVLRDGGTLWINIGDSYASGPKKRSPEQACRKSNLNGGKSTQIACKDQPNKITGTLKQKDLIGIPWMLAFSLRDDGWYLRQDIIWHKPNPMPESVTDRCTKSHEYIFLFSKSSKYYYDHVAIKTPLKDASVLRLTQNIESQQGSERVPGKTNGNMKAVGPAIGGRKHKNLSDKGQKINTFHRTRGEGKGWQPKMGGSGNDFDGHSGNFDQYGNLIGGGFANKRSVWSVATKPFKEAHFATFPESLIVDMIKAGCPEQGIVLDPFMGAGTTALVAKKLNRLSIGFEINPDYIAISKSRCDAWEPEVVKSKNQLQLFSNHNE